VLACFALLPGAQAGDAPTPELALPGFNTADGFNALINVTTGVFNSAFGAKALQADTSGSHNTALGGQALLHNNGSYNTAVGENALVFNTSGSFNMALGQGALANNLMGTSNVAMGFQALNANTASDNVAVGFQALLSNSSGHENTGVGNFALFDNTASSNNTAVGNSALAHTTGSSNVALGASAGLNISAGNFNIDIGNPGVAGDSNTIRVGTAQTACYIGGISGQSAVGGDAVFVTSAGKLGTITAVSSARFKDEIKPMDKASEVILALKPVTFRYKKELDPKRIPQFGLVAEEVEKVNPDLVKRDRDGSLQTVRYDAVNAMLLNEFLKEHRMVQEQQKEIDALKAELKRQRALIQKVNDKVELGKPAPQTVLNSQ
jgi:endosialidase-like protein